MNWQIRKGDDVAVMGASAAGLYSASLLARTGRQVRVFDASPRIDPSPRTLIVTDSFRTLMGSHAEECVVNEIKHFQLFANGCAATVSLARPDLVVEREALRPERLPRLRVEAPRAVGAEVAVEASRLRHGRGRGPAAEPVDV